MNINLPALILEEAEKIFTETIKLIGKEDGTYKMPIYCLDDLISVLEKYKYEIPEYVNMRQYINPTKVLRRHYSIDTEWVIDGSFKIWNDENIYDYKLLFWYCFLKQYRYDTYRKLTNVFRREQGYYNRGISNKTVIERLNKVKSISDKTLSDIKTTENGKYNIEEIEHLAEDITQTLFLITQNIKGAYGGKNG